MRSSGFIRSEAISQPRAGCDCGEGSLTSANEGYRLRNGSVLEWLYAWSDDDVAQATEFSVIGAVAPRYDKLAVRLLATVTLAAIRLGL